MDVPLSSDADDRADAVSTMFPAITPEETAEMIAKAIVTRPKKVATRLGDFGELLYAVARRSTTKTSTPPTNCSGFSGGEGERGRGARKAHSTEAVAFAHFMKGVHW